MNDGTYIYAQNQSGRVMKIVPHMVYSHKRLRLRHFPFMFSFKANFIAIGGIVGPVHIFMTVLAM